LKTAKADSSPKDSFVSVREWLDFATERVPQLQEERIKSRDLGVQSGSPASDGNGQKNSSEAGISDVQRPRAFYRREIEPQPLIVARP